MPAMIPLENPDYIEAKHKVKLKEGICCIISHFHSGVGNEESEHQVINQYEEKTIPPALQ